MLNISFKNSGMGCYGWQTTIFININILNLDFIVSSFNSSNFSVLNECNIIQNGFHLILSCKWFVDRNTRWYFATFNFMKGKNRKLQKKTTIFIPYSRGVKLKCVRRLFSINQNSRGPHHFITILSKIHRFLYGYLCKLSNIKILKGIQNKC